MQHVGSCDLKTRQCSDRTVQHNSAMVEDFLELGGGFFAFMDRQIGFAAHIYGIQGVPNEMRLPLSQPDDVRRSKLPPA